MRKRTSKIWTQLGDKEFEDLVLKSNTFKEILNYFGFENKGSNHITLKARMNYLSIDYSHIKNHNSYHKMVACQKERSIPPNIVFVENSKYSRKLAKSKIIKYSLLDYGTCSICGLSSMWQGRPIVMILDHINGISNDHRLENLRLVCPNCNSQLPTHCGGNKSAI